MIVTAHTFATSSTWTPPSGMTEGFDVQVQPVQQAFGQSVEGDYATQAAAGATGAKTATAAGSGADADIGATHILALRPIVVVAVPQLYYIHTDHLNTPRLIANADQQTVWKWDQQEPFGVNAPDENPSSLGTFEFALRFPGQYFDKETNLAYNYFRDYDAATGRYVESDPIGLKGGVNTYTYVAANSLSRIDAVGLQAIPIPFPLAGVPALPANRNLSNALTRIIRRIADACRSRGKCHLYDAVWDMNPEDLYIDPSSPRPIAVGGVIKCFYHCDSGDHRVVTWPVPPGFRMSREQAMRWCDQEFDE
jgi:RHS repeat-associated protein